MSHESVEAAMEKFRNAGETGEVYGTPINHEGGVYFYAVYKKDNHAVGVIIVTADGEVLSLDQIKEVLYIALGAYSTALIIMGEFRQWAQAPTELLKKQIGVLTKVESSFDLPDDIGKAFAQFKNVPKTLLEEQEKLVIAVQEGVKYNQNILEITSDTERRMTEYFIRIMGCKYKQHVSMVDTYEDRKKVLDYLKGQVTMFQPKKWLLYNDLKAQHQAFSVSKADLQAHEDVKDDIYGQEARKEVFKQTLRTARNPKV